VASAHRTARRPALGRPAPRRSQRPRPGPSCAGVWDDEETADDGLSQLPDPALELEAGRAALVAGALEQAALRLALALRLAPALAPAVLEATAGARGPAIAMVRGDAYRLAGHEEEARQAYAVAAHGGAPERRKRSRTKAAKAKAKTKAVAGDNAVATSAEIGPDEADPGIDPSTETKAPDDTDP